MTFQENVKKLLYDIYNNATDEVLIKTTLEDFQEENVEELELK